MKTKRKIKVQRHSKLYIFLHWLIVVEVLVLLITGLNLTLGSPGSEVVSFLSRGTARSIHIAVASAWVATVLFFLYYFVISGEYFCFGLTNSLRAIDFFIKEIRMFLLGRKLECLIKYDVKKDQYLHKITPTEVVAWWLWFTLWVLIGITGIALLFPQDFGLILRICHFLVPGWPDPLSSTQVLHGLIAVMFVVVMIIHAYSAWYFGLLKSMITGEHEVPVAEEEK